MRRLQPVLSGVARRPYPLQGVRLRSARPTGSLPPSGGCLPPVPRLPHTLQLRSFRSTPPRGDIFFASFPAIKSTLLSLTRVSLLALPFVFRYKLWNKYRRTSWLLIQIPVFAVCIVVALGLDQSPRTGRWRLLLMSENEELAWSYRKHKDVLMHDGPLLLPPEDPRCEQIARVATRLVTALEEQDGHVIAGAAWPPRQQLLRAIHEKEEREDRLDRYKPSATAKSSYMPFRPESSNPLKLLESADWKIYVFDLPLVNAFALPSKEIIVYTGLLDVLPGDDSMLGAVLAHEIAHVVERHSVENIGFLNLAAVGFDVLRGFAFAFTISFPVITDGAAMFINWVNDVVAERAYSRKLEQEADTVGLELMATAGYDPRSMLDLWELMAAVDADAEASGRHRSLDQKIALLRTHPTSEERQKAILDKLPRALNMMREATAKRQPKRATIEYLIQEAEVLQKATAGEVVEVTPIDPHIEELAVRQC